MGCGETQSLRRQLCWAEPGQKGDMRQRAMRAAMGQAAIMSDWTCDSVIFIYTINEIDCNLFLGKVVIPMQISGLGSIATFQRPEWCSPLVM